MLDSFTETISFLCIHPPPYICSLPAFSKIQLAMTHSSSQAQLHPRITNIISSTSYLHNLNFVYITNCLIFFHNWYLPRYMVFLGTVGTNKINTHRHTKDVQGILYYPGSRDRRFKLVKLKTSREKCG